MTENTRVSTGVPGLDEVLEGGLMKDHTYLIAGVAGTGKTICSIQWLHDQHRRGRGGLFISLAEPVDNIRMNVSGFGWNLGGIDFVDLTPTAEEPELRTDEYSVFHPSEVEQEPLWQGIYQAIRERQPDSVVIDSMTQLRFLSTDDYQFRKHVLSLVQFLHQRHCTSLLTFEPTELEREAALSLAVDGIIHLRTEISPQRVIGLRSVHVQKLRGSDFMSGLHPMRITAQGVRVYPHRVERPGPVRPGMAVCASGIDNLDAVLGGGLESGTTTILSGPAGAGKSTLGLHFLVEAASRGDGAVIYAFEESPESMTARAVRLGMPIEPLLDSGLLRIERVNPMELYPDELLEMLRAAVQGDGRKVVMIDSLRGYELAMEEFGSLIAHIHNLVTYLNRMEATTILVSEVEHITGPLVATDQGISYLADNIILLRYAEHAGRVIKVIACLKKRQGVFDPGLRELRITGQGIAVSDELKSLHGILTGAPSSDPEARRK